MDGIIDSSFWEKKNPACLIKILKIRLEKLFINFFWPKQRIFTSLQTKPKILILNRNGGNFKKFTWFSFNVCINLMIISSQNIYGTENQDHGKIES